MALTADFVALIKTNSVLACTLTLFIFFRGEGLWPFFVGQVGLEHDPLSLVS